VTSPIDANPIGIWIDHRKAVITELAPDGARLTGALNHYYDRIIAALPHQDGLYLFGPGEAKGELQRRLLKTHPQVAAATIETTDKLTDKQIMAAVRKHFGKYGWLVAAPGSTMDPLPRGRDS
jgi:hypothetical protein